MALPSRPLWAVFLLVHLAVSVHSFTTPSLDSSARVQPQHHNAPCIHISMSSTALSERRLLSRLRASPSSFDSGTKKVLVKERARVSLDRDTGKLTEISPAPSIDNGREGNPWNVFKQTVYGAADVVTSLPTMVLKNSKPTTPSKPVDGYSSSTLKNKASLESPGQLLMKKYQARALDTNDKPPTTTAFEEIKKGLYNTFDGVVANMVQPEQQTPKPPPLQSFKAVIKPTFASSPVVKEALPDLQSKSPGKRWLAELKIRNWEEEQRRRKRKYERDQAAEKFKKVAYGIGDVTIDIVKSLVTLPDRIQEASRDLQTAFTEFMAWALSVPGAVERTVDTVSQIPDKVQTKLETSIETTKKVVEDVQAIPSKIEETVKVTQRTVEDTVTNVKILVGVEQKKPMPPKIPPPPPMTAQELAWKVAGGVATVSAKLAWWVVVELGKLGISGAQVGIQKIMSETIVQQQQQQKQQQQQQQQQQRIPEKVMESTTMTTTTTLQQEPQKQIASKMDSITNKEAALDISAKVESLDSEMDALNQEVSEALQLAEKALKMADKDEGKDDDGGNKSELDDALQKAREAAILATKAAVEIERNNI
jgi:hypothetical protein